jgi:lysine 6-dehydrogenase
MKIIVLGAGRVGSAIIKDLAKEPDFEVKAVDASSESLGRLQGVDNVTTRQADLSDGNTVAKVVQEADLVVGAVPGPMGYKTLETVLECGKNAVDISFFEEDAFRLDALARQKGLTAIVDCGIAPGCWNIVVGYQEAAMDRLHRVECMVGGLPVVRAHPYEYKAVFSPIDVIAEYTRPARILVDGKVVTQPALSKLELEDFPGVGTLEAFYTDGLRTLLTTVKAPCMREKTLRYPGHVEKIKLLRDTGFFSETPVDLNGVKICPMDLTARLLFPMWQLSEGEEDLTVMRIVVAGEKDGRRQRHTYELLDRYDRITKTTAMARTTGYSCTAVVRLVASGRYKKMGISPPEFVGREPGCYQFVIEDLARHGVVLKETIS